MTQRRQFITAMAIGISIPLLARGNTPDYPSRPLKIIVGFPPGGSSDNTVRLLGAALQKQIGQPVIVENRPGASGAIAAQAVAAERPDGYTLLYATSSSHAIAPHFNPKLGYDPLNDFTPITLIGRAGLVLTANNSLPVKDITDLIRYAKQQPPDTITYASPGQTSSQHLAIALLSRAAGIELRHIPYKGSAPGLMDLVGGQVNLMIDNLTAPLPFIRDGKIRPLAVTSIKRAEMLPDVPTLDESGIAGFDVQAWGGIMAPANLPAPLTAKLNREINIALTDPAVRKSMHDAGNVPQGGSSTDFANFVAGESAFWKRSIGQSDINRG
ncbi:Bug family tripartite tricarboxylate transporter substrate binding protein [Bordetella tumulicola]|uniref:Bug family tripartite tricarboxylate transporter substrate binding protein n=1 Tax=Bordetella tumulicola TaxID=1649133 RepID=UPI0039EE73B0